MAITRIDKPTRFRADADAYHPELGGYIKRGDFFVAPAGYAISQTWTEVDDDGEPVKGGHKSSKIARIVERPRGSENKSMRDIADDGERELEDGGGELADEEPSSSSPTPPAAPAKPKAAAPAKKPAAPAKPKRS